MYQQPKMKKKMSWKLWLTLVGIGLLFVLYVVLKLLGGMTEALVAWGVDPQIIAIAQGGAALPAPTMDELTGVVTSTVQATATVYNTVENSGGWSTVGVLVGGLAALVALWQYAAILEYIQTLIRRAPMAADKKYAPLFLLASFVVFSWVYGKAVGPENYIRQLLPVLAVAVMILVVYFSIPSI